MGGPLLPPTYQNSAGQSFRLCFVGEGSWTQLYSPTGLYSPHNMDAAFGYNDNVVEDNDHDDDDDDGEGRSEASIDNTDAGMDVGGQLAYLADQLARGRSYHEPTWMEHTRNANSDRGNRGDGGKGGTRVSPESDHTNKHGLTYFVGDFTLTEVPPPPSHLKGSHKRSSKGDGSSYRPASVQSHGHTPELCSAMKQKALDLESGEKPGARVINALLTILDSSGLLRAKKE